MPEPHLRAADTDRAAVADVLGAHMSAGRLTVDEYDERLSRAYAAKTYGELDELTADLPAARHQHVRRRYPRPGSEPRVPCHRRLRHPERRGPGGWDQRQPGAPG